MAPDPKSDAVDALIDEVIVDAHGDAEQLQAFQQEFHDRLDRVHFQIWGRIHFRVPRELSRRPLCCWVPL